MPTSEGLHSFEIIIRLDHISSTDPVQQDNFADPGSTLYRPKSVGGTDNLEIEEC